ncbi:MAG TPA: dephospho-CoA kinase [Xanthobacteraceae bacterium]|nr:dephospho-CoA kinase [Xanthobacteraceae bacterium]
MIVLGLTGSAAMGKSATAKMFGEEGVPVFDADAAVHRLYEGAAVAPVEAAFPGVTVNGRIDRERLAAKVLDNPEALKALEALVHPLVRAEQDKFRRDAAESGTPIAVLDIPLLFETGGDLRADAVVVVSAPAQVQRARLLERPGMTVEKIDAMLARQMPDAEKRRRADFVIDTSRGFDAARADVRRILEQIRRHGIPKKN